MTTVTVNRPARRPEPSYPAGEVVLAAPPELPDDSRRNWTRLIMILPMLAGAGAMAMMYSRFGGGGGPLAYLPGALFGLSALGMAAVVFSQQAAGKGKREMARERRRYLRQLSQQRAQVRKTIAQQQVASRYRHPDPDTLWTLPDTSRLWERRRGDVDFAQIRIGLGPQELATPLIPPESRPLEDLEPMCALALRRFITTYAAVPRLPVVMAINGFATVYLRGDLARGRGLCRALLAQLAVLHAPEDVLVAVCAGPAQRPEWEWVKWLPHGLHPTKTDVVGPIRLVTSAVADLEGELAELLAERPRAGVTSTGPSAYPHLVVVRDGADTGGAAHLLPDRGLAGVTLITLDAEAPPVLDPATLVLDVTPDGELHSAGYGGEQWLGVADSLSMAEVEPLAWQLAARRLPAEPAVVAGGAVDLDAGLTGLLQLGDPDKFDPQQAWSSPRPERQRLRVPIGVGEDGSPVELDLKESAQDGMGPHGLLIGATGSGKSELLRTLVLGLAASHDSRTLNFVLVDFKGGATFTTLDRLPHTSAVITNLADELPLVDRMTEAISGELIRRQELLRRAGNFASQRDYEQARQAGAPLAPLPSLLLICDEFSELLSAKPEFVEMFVQIGRVGRSLGVHLLLASQRLEEGRLRGLSDNLSYRIGLRTFSASESRAVLGVQDAYHLPRAPGHAYLKTGTDELTRFKAAYVSGEHRPPSAPSQPPGDGRTATSVQAYTTAVQLTLAEPEPEPEPGPAEPSGTDLAGASLLDLLVERIAGQGEPAHRVWLPPLREPATLDQLLPALAITGDRGYTVSEAAVQGQLRAPVGVVDKPLEQRREPLWLDFAGAAGHLMLVGGPQSGKSTLLRTVITSLALTHTPSEVQFYCLDLGGGGLVGLRDLPHVGGVATRRDVSQVRRTIAEVQAVMAQREDRFAREGVESMSRYRQRCRDDDPDPYGDVVLVVDGWSTIRSDFDELTEAVVEIVNRGLSFGVHVVATAHRWMDVRHTVRDVFGTKLELRLGDPSDSLLGRRVAANVPEHAPGRGITGDSLHFLAALPRADGDSDVADLAAGSSALVTTVRDAWSGAAAPPVRLLPSKVPFARLPTGEWPGLPIGIAESDLGPVSLDFDSDPHFLVFGAGECGKSSFLHTLAHQLVSHRTPEQARLVVVDYRRSLLGAVTTSHQIGYGSSAEVTATIVKEVAGVMRQRLPGPEVTPQQLKDRSWWHGPELYVLVDDYDLVAAGQPNPLGPLLEFLPQGRDVGLHLVLARRSGGAARALFEPLIMRLRELDSPGLVMSGSRDEGKLLGDVRPTPLPAGRGWLVTRGQPPRLIQLAHRPPD